MAFGKNKRARDVEEPATAPETDAAAASPDAAESVEPDAPAKKKRKPDIISIILGLIMIVGLGVIAYPTFSDWWNSYHMSRAIATYVAAVEETDPKVIEQMFEDANAYNEKLLWNNNRYHMSDEDRAEYNALLNLTGDGVIGYIQIASIGVNLPIYHGTSESVLQVAIGHIEGTSLPVGGPSTHAVVSGHRGLPSAKLFTDIDRLTEGDTFTITVLNQTATYQVDQIRIVLPSDMSDLDIQPAADYVTLITCTPYGINTHRLLVRGHRIDNLAAIAAIPAEAVQIPSYIAVPAVGVPMLFVYLLGMLVHYRLTKSNYDKDAVMGALAHLQHSREVPIRPPAEDTPAAEEEDKS